MGGAVVGGSLGRSVTRGSMLTFAQCKPMSYILCLDVLILLVSLLSNCFYVQVDTVNFGSGMNEVCCVVS